MDFVVAKSQVELMEYLAFLSFESFYLGLGFFFSHFPFFNYTPPLPQRFGQALRIEDIDGEWCLLTEESFRRKFDYIWVWQTDPRFLVPEREREKGR